MTVELLGTAAGRFEAVAPAEYSCASTKGPQLLLSS